MLLWSIGALSQPCIPTMGDRSMLLCQHLPSSTGTAWLKKTEPGEKEWVEPSTAGIRKFAHSHGLSPTIPWLQREGKARCRALCHSPAAHPGKAGRSNPGETQPPEDRLAKRGEITAPLSVPLVTADPQCFLAVWTSLLLERKSKKLVHPKHDHCCVTLAEH